MHLRESNVAHVLLELETKGEGNFFLYLSPSDLIEEHERERKIDACFRLKTWKIFMKDVMRMKKAILFTT